MADSTTEQDRGCIRRAQPDGAVLFCGSHLRIRVAVLKPGIVLATASGEAIDIDDAMAEAAMLEELDREFERAGSLTLFADLRQSARMPAASREKFARWARRHQSRLVLSHVLVRSTLIEMALSIITMLVGGGLFKVHTNPKKFLALVKAAAPKLQELPSVPSPS